MECEKYNSESLLLTLSKANRILTESKPEVQKALICSKSKSDAGESKEATSLAILLLTFSKLLLQMGETKNIASRRWETKTKIK